MRRLIEDASPLKKVSEDSKHEKSAGRMGHISTLHIWPARRPLAASRAAVIAALLPDPGDAPPEVRSEYQRLAGSSDPVKQREDFCARIEKVTRWGGIDERELDVLRGLIRKTYGGEPPKVLDIFAGGGAIPLEAMRLGAHAIAVEYNPVAWFILKCTLEFPSKLAGKTWPLPKGDDEAANRELFARDEESGDLAAHVRYWGEWVRKHVEEDLRPYFPVVDGKPPVAYFWARTVPCQDPKCGATVPLLMTQWLCTKKGKERALQLHPDKKTRQVQFEVFSPKGKADVGVARVDHRLGSWQAGAGSRSLAGLAVCGGVLIMSLSDQELEALARSGEAQRVERKPSDKQKNEIRDAICAFANDFPGHGRPGVVFVGLNDDGSCTGLPIGDELLRNLADLRTDGNILPLPTMSVEKRTVLGCEVAAVIVDPSPNLPVRVRGRTMIRVGTRRGMATVEEEQPLVERARARVLPFDARSLPGSGLGIARKALEENGSPPPEFTVTDTHVLVTIRRRPSARSIG